MIKIQTDPLPNSYIDLFLIFVLFIEWSVVRVFPHCLSSVGLHLFRDVVEHRMIISRGDHVVRNSEVKPKLFIDENDMLGLVDGKDTVDCCL